MNPSDPFDLYNALFFRKKPTDASNQINKLVYSDRLVLYWPHIGLHENQTDESIHEHHESDIDGRCRIRVFIRSVEIQTVSGVLAAEDVGKFAHEIVAESLQRVSGVSISREFGEGECVSIFN